MKFIVFLFNMNTNIAQYKVTQLVCVHLHSSCVDSKEGKKQKQPPAQQVCRFKTTHIYHLVASREGILKRRSCT